MEETQRLQLAFGVYVIELIINADDRLDYDEMRMVGQIFPRPLLREAGFLDKNNGWTPALEAAQKEAVSTLAHTLDADQKLDFMRLFWEAAMVDDELEAREVQVLHEAATYLGIDPIEFTMKLGEWAAETAGS